MNEVIGRTAEPRGSVIVFEKRPFRQPELQRQFAGEPISVRRCIERIDISQLGKDEHCVVVLQFDDAPAICLQMLAAWNESVMPGVRVVVLGSKASSELEWTVRELGAFAFLDESIRGEALARICRRHFESME